MFGRQQGYTDEERAHFGELVPCLFCGGHHERQCPRVREVHLDTTGKILAAKYWEKWDQSSTIFPEQLEEDVHVPMWGRVQEKLVMAKQRLKDKVENWFWTQSYLSWAMRIAVFAVTTTAVILLGVGLISLIVHCLSWV